MLYQRVNLRVEQMMAQGLLDEVRGLLEAGVPAEAQAMKAIGYKELVPCVLSGAPVDEAVAAIQQGTRRYAKRQLTWFRHETDIHWVEALAPDALEQLIAYYQS